MEDVWLPTDSQHRNGDSGYVGGELRKVGHSAAEFARRPAQQCALHWPLMLMQPWMALVGMASDDGKCCQIQGADSLIEAVAGLATGLIRSACAKRVRRD